MTKMCDETKDAATILKKQSKQLHKYSTKMNSKIMKLENDLTDLREKFGKLTEDILQEVRMDFVVYIKSRQ